MPTAQLSSHKQIHWELSRYEGHWHPAITGIRQGSICHPRMCMPINSHRVYRRRRATRRRRRRAPRRRHGRRQAPPAPARRRAGGRTWARVRPLSTHTPSLPCSTLTLATRVCVCVCVRACVRVYVCVCVCVCV